MNRIIRAFAAFIVSICLILAPSIQYANAASAWGIRNAISKGASTIIVASKNGYKSAVSVAPSAVSVGGRLLKGANQAAVAYALFQMLNKSVDHVMDPANNRVIWTDPAVKDTYMVGGRGVYYSTPLEACKEFFIENGGIHLFTSLNGMTCKGYTRFGYPTEMQVELMPKAKNYVPIDDVANSVINSSSNGHKASQVATKEAAMEMVIGGTFDPQLESAAVPGTQTDDTPPKVPSLPIGNNGDVTPGAVPGSQNSSKDAADRAKKAADAAANAADAAKDAAKDAADDAADLINSAIDQAVKDAVKDAAKDAASAAKDAAKDAAAAANEAARKAAADARASAAEKAAAEARADATKSAADVAAAEKAAAEARADAAAAKERADAAEKAADRAKAEATKPFELPPFCSWAKPVCDFIDWVKADPQLEEPEDTRPEIQDLTKYDTVDISKKYVTATGQCPPAADLNINFGVVKLSYEPLCIILDKLSGVIVAVAYISVGFMIIRTV